MRFILIVVVPLIIFYACGEQSKFIQQSTPSTSFLKLTFKLNIDKDNYLNSIYGESPQIAIWLEDTLGTKMKNVYVTYRSGKNEWIGKVYCKVALPYWESRLNKFFKNRTNVKNEIDAVTKATSKNNEVVAMIYLPKKSVWKYFIEVNVAGDYNEFFATYSKNGVPDSDGNGQPSVVYSGIVKIEKGFKSVPKIIGRTLQMRQTGKLIKNLSGITTAKQILSSIKVKVL